MTNEGEVYFALYGDEFDPQEVTSIVGIAPSSVHRKKGRSLGRSMWKLSAGKLEADVIDVYDMTSALVDRLRPRGRQIIAAKQRFSMEAVLQVVLRITTDETVSTPAIGFSREVIEFLSSVGASIDVDTYR